ncbi:unnamed protein product, partial [Meganyctiphanes norvegica]
MPNQTVKRENSLDSMRNEELFNAVIAGDVPGVHAALQNGADVNWKSNDDISGVTPLYMACHWGHSTIVEMLVNANADVNMANDYGETPLSVASSIGDSTIVEMLLNANADVNIAQDDGFTPLQTACSFGHSTIVEMLVKSNADVNIANCDGSTP